jgi:hypothetical protein
MGETAHRRGAYPRGRPGEFKGHGELMGGMECRRISLNFAQEVAKSPIRRLAHSPPGS